MTRRPGVGALRSRTTWVAVVVGLVAVVVLVVLTTHLTRGGTAGTGDTGSTSLTARPASGVPVAVFLGDSYTVGVGEGLGYVEPTAQAMGWTALNLGQGGTGYLNDGALTSADLDPYRARIRQVVAAHPDIVIVQGSPNDVEQPGDLQAAAADVFEALEAGLPHARIIVVGTTDPPSMDQVDAVDLSRAVGRAAAAAGLTFIDPIALAWLPRDDASLFVADRLHPSATGYQAYTAGLVKELRALVPAS